MTDYTAQKTKEEGGVAHMNAAPKTTRFVIRGGSPLEGEIRVRGMKNAATPIIAATLLISGECVIKNVPQLTDVERMLDILRSLGVAVEWQDRHTLRIDSSAADIGSLDTKTVKSMRSSILFTGPLLARFKQVRIPEPGGCIIGNRPIDTHLVALKALGAVVTRVNGTFELNAENLAGTTIILPEFSVTATENVLMAATLAQGTTTIKMAAAEPHVQDLARFLVSAGAKIKGIGTHTLTVEGVERLEGTTHTVIPDQIEAGTFAVLGAVTKGTVRITGIMPEHLDMVLLKLKSAGVRFNVENGALIIGNQSSLKAFKLQTMPYPGFPTDLQAPFGVLATQCSGTSLIHDPLFESRLGYINELSKMGANATICDPHRVLVTGPTPLYGQEIRSFDLRAGATLVIAGLVAQGETVLHDADVLDRGYEHIDTRLQAVGADIERVTS